MFILQIFRIKRNIKWEKLSAIGKFSCFLKVNVIKIKKISNMILYKLETLMLVIGCVEGF